MPELKLVNLACMPHAAGECMRSACALYAMGHAPTYVGCDCIYALWFSVYAFTALGGRAYGSRCSLVRVAWAFDGILMAYPYADDAVQYRVLLCFHRARLPWSSLMLLAI